MKRAKASGEICKGNDDERQSLKGPGTGGSVEFGSSGVGAEIQKTSCADDAQAPKPTEESRNLVSSPVECRITSSHHAMSHHNVKG